MKPVGVVGVVGACRTSPASSVELKVQTDMCMMTVGGWERVVGSAPEVPCW